MYYFMITEAEFKDALPAQIRKSVNPELIDMINTSLADREAMEIYKENLISFTSVLKQGKFKLTNYINAVRYVGFKITGSTNIDAYIKTFPDKYQRFLREGIEAKDIASYVSAYNKSKLVMLIFEQALIPIHILNAPMFQKAINVQAELMMSAKSEMVRFSAANSLMTHLKPPETKKIELDLGLKENGSIQALHESTMALVEQQKKLLAAGATALDIAQSTLLIEGSLEEVHD